MYKNDLKIVDCVILTYKPSYDFVLLLNNLINQDYKINKIYIINTEEKYFYINFDSEQKIELLNIINDERIEIINIKEEDFDHGATRNLIINYSNADYIVYFTSDSIPYNNDLITNLDTFISLNFFPIKQFLFYFSINNKWSIFIKIYNINFNYILFKK